MHALKSNAKIEEEHACWIRGCGVRFSLNCADDIDANKGSMLTKDLFIFNLFRLILLITLSHNYITRLLFVHKKKKCKIGQN